MKRFVSLASAMMAGAVMARLHENNSYKPIDESYGQYGLNAQDKKDIAP
jgi:hypothetical protein